MAYIVHVRLSDLIDAVRERGAEVVCVQATRERDHHGGIPVREQAHLVVTAAIPTSQDPLRDSGSIVHGVRCPINSIQLLCPDDMIAQLQAQLQRDSQLITSRVSRVFETLGCTVSSGIMLEEKMYDNLKRIDADPSLWGWERQGQVYTIVWKGGDS